jgi:hypothetical protein
MSDGPWDMTWWEYGSPAGAAHESRSEDNRAQSIRRAMTQKRKARTAARGYGSKHKALRRRWAAQVAEGEARCARCGGVIWADEPWDLGHDDHDRTRYTGPEHRRCNRATAAHRTQRRRRTHWAWS